MWRLVRNWRLLNVCIGLLPRKVDEFGASSSGIGRYGIYLTEVNHPRSSPARPTKPKHLMHFSYNFHNKNVPLLWVPVAMGYRTGGWSIM